MYVTDSAIGSIGEEGSIILLMKILEHLIIRKKIKFNPKQHAMNAMIATQPISDSTEQLTRLIDLNSDLSVHGGGPVPIITLFSYANTFVFVPDPLEQNGVCQSDGNG